LVEVIMSTADDKIAELLSRLPTRVSGKADRSDCPDEEILASFLAGNLEKDAERTLESHLARCSFCCEDLAAANKFDEFANTERVPQRLIERVMGLVSERENSFDLIVRLVNGSLELIRTAARVTPISAPLLRGGAKPAKGDALQVEQEVGRFRVTVELDLREAGTCQVIANVTEESGKPAEGIRMSLSSAEREHASFLARAGVVVFDRVAPGEYSIAVSESGAVVGKIRLSLMM
jgi:hypothetical protein